MRKKKLTKKILYISALAGKMFVLIIIFFLFFGLPSYSLKEKIYLESDNQIIYNFLVDSSNNIIKTTPSFVSVETNNQEINNQNTSNQKTNSQNISNQYLKSRLVIPKIEVNANIESVGLTADGSVDVPKNPANAAWYNLSPQPGENGSAIISGHYGRWKDGQGSVFDDLNLLKIGDKLYTINGDGVITNFIVRDIKKYDSEARAFDVFGVNDNKAHLNLITCQGVWDKKTETYSDRLVIFTDKE